MFNHPADPSIIPLLEEYSAATIDAVNAYLAEHHIPDLLPEHPCTLMLWLGHELWWAEVPVFVDGEVIGTALVSVVDDSEPEVCLTTTLDPEPLADWRAEHIINYGWGELFSYCYGFNRLGDDGKGWYKV